MPIYEYECSWCQKIFEEFHKSYEKAGRSWCPKCGNSAFKIPSVSAPRIFKQREFADGTKTPDHIRTHSQEKKWLKKEGITLDKPTGKEKRHRQEERFTKTKTSMALAFEKADKIRQAKGGLNG